ncbi:MAG: ACT domain-containing protein [Chitinispirillales bacterium]|jgi:prephenate dehydratase|nr:ACT domain-containing protein [Chitinispirillales bacterium]
MAETQKISVLGPQETFSDYAAQKYLEFHPQICAEISYQRTMRKVFENLSSGNSQIAVVPIENIFSGFVWMTLDGLYDFPVQIIEEFILPIELSFLSKIKHSEVKNIFVHSVTEGQCSDFIDKNFNSARITHTDSNIDSFNRIDENDFSAAIVPSHIYDKNKKNYPFSVRGVSDYPNNRTRFVVLQNEKFIAKDNFKNLNKTSIIVSDNSDSPGILRNIADAFASREINITSIISRPTKQMIGKYHFFIDIESPIQNKILINAFAEIKKNYPVKILGCYETAK